MPYLLLVIGLLIALSLLYRFFMKAETNQIKALFLSALLMTLCAALFYLALTGKLVAALGLIAAMIPFVIGYLKKKEQAENVSAPVSSVMTRAEAYKVLNLPDGAAEDDIQDSYKKLMMKVHPDQQGSDWMAAKLNEARDLLLRKQG